MPGLVAPRNRSIAGYFVAIVVGSIACAGSASIQTVAALDGTIVGATVCSTTSTIMLDSPVSDSIVTQSSIQIAGNVTQSSQIEIRVDGVFDSILPLTIGQTTFTSSVQVSPGTHTITVNAVSVCPGGNGTASVVVTYEAPPQVPSSGDQTATAVGDGVGGVTVTRNGGSDESQNGVGFIDTILQPLRGLAEWLNIDLGDAGHRSVVTMPITRAVVFTAGLYVLIIGLAPSMVQTMAGFSFIAGILPHAAVPVRLRMVAVASRSVGLLLVLGSLFIP